MKYWLKNHKGVNISPSYKAGNANPYEVLEVPDIKNPFNWMGFMKKQRRPSELNRITPTKRSRRE
jgi:hypothetical protein